MSTRYEDLSINDKRLFIDNRVQRPFEAAKAAKIAAEWNKDEIGPFLLSERTDGNLAILDGQTRRGAAKMINYQGIIHAEIRTGLTLAQEADGFLTRNNNKPIAVIAKFRVRVTRGDTAPTEISKILRGYGWRVQSGNGDGCFKAVSALENTYKAAGTDGQFAVDRIVKTVTNAWGLMSEGMNQNIISGLTDIYCRFGSAVDRTRLSHVMEETTPKRLIAQAELYQELTKSTLGHSVAETLRGRYNTGIRKNQLPEWN
jgi:hypothetical protein